MPSDIEIHGYTQQFLQNQEQSAYNYRELLQSFGSADVLKASDYPEDYGGAYINHAGILVVYALGDVDKAKKAFGTRTKNTDITIRTCRHSFRTLTETMDMLNAFMLSEHDSDTAQNIAAYSLLDAENIVVVELRDFTQERIDEIKKSISLDLCVEYVQAYGEGRADVNVNPGDAISAQGGGGSVGFRVKLSDIEGIVTAAHVATSSATGSNDITKNGTVFAQCTTRQFSGSADAAFCKITSTSYTPTNLIGGTSTLSTTIDTPAAGQIVNMLGATTGYTNGTIISTNATLTYGGATIYYLVTADYTRAGGDSGGIVYTYYSTTNVRNTVGIHVAYSGSTAYYCRASYVNGALGTSRY
jgi:hypothetical protein